MPFNKNFDVKQTLYDDKIVLAGSSTVDVGATVVFRHVEIAQGTSHVGGSATLAEDWVGVLDVQPGAFAAGPAIASGFEVHVDATPGTITFSWSHPVTIDVRAGAMP